MPGSVKYVVMIRVNVALLVHTLLSSCGRYSSDDAKITGMMPAWLTLSGM